MNASDRFLGQEPVLSRDRLAGLDVSIIGVGAIGRQVALQLAAWGLPKLRLLDFAIVEPVHITTQGYLHADIGRAKVDATAGAIWLIDPLVNVETIADGYRPPLEIGDIVFCCVDSMETRAAIWSAAARRASLWCDGRIHGEAIRILTACAAYGRDHYPTTLAAPSDTPVGSHKSHGNIFTAGIAAGLLAHQFTRWLRGLPIDSDLSLDLLANELHVARAKPPDDR
jgi:sulfur carrier protein ThiS adenylyltransferase